VLTGSDIVHDSFVEPLDQRVAAALGWRQGLARLESPGIQADGFKLLRGFLGPQRATVFATNGGSPAREFLPDAARFAYHSSIHWGIVADDNGCTIFNSHWIRNEQWFRLPEIRWSEFTSFANELTAFTPEGVATGRLDQLAARFHPPDRILTPVDDALVARLDHWRLEALRFGDTVEGLDEHLHTIFAQFFVIRAVEDRGLAPSVPPLSSALMGQRLDTARLRDLFARAREIIQSQLFVEEPLNRLPEFVLAGIIQDLYTPSQLPQGSRRYNFAWIDADILGRACEKYLEAVRLK